MIRIGVIGYGYWGPNLARAVSESGVARLEMIADMSAKALERAALRHPAARLTTHIDELIRDTSVDAIMIATPVSTHYELALAGLQANKHVLVEKPMTHRLDHAQHLVQEAARRNRVLMVDHTFVYTPVVRKIAEMIDYGELGDIFYYDSMRVNLGLFQRDVNVIWDLAVHDFAIVDQLLGQTPVSVSACAARFMPGSPENMAQLTVQYDGGAMAHLNVNWLSPIKIRQTLIGGSQKMVVWDDMENSEKLKVYDRGAEANAKPGAASHEQLVSYRLGDMYAPALSTKEALLTEVEEFVRCIDTNARPLTDGLCGMRVVELLVAASRSAQQGGHPIELHALKVA